VDGANDKVTVNSVSKDMKPKHVISPEEIGHEEGAAELGLSCKDGGDITRGYPCVQKREAAQCHNGTVKRYQ
jgi:hypothetical protein